MHRKVLTAMDLGRYGSSRTCFEQRVDSNPRGVTLHDFGARQPDSATSPRPQAFNKFRADVTGTRLCFRGQRCCSAEGLKPSHVPLIICRD